MILFQIILLKKGSGVQARGGGAWGTEYHSRYYGYLDDRREQMIENMDIESR
jgi:hypothetical protein